MSGPARAELSRGSRIGIVVAAVAIVVGAIVLLPSPSPSAVVATPSPTASPSTSPSPSVTASPTPSPTPSPSPTLAVGRYVNARLGFSVQLTPPWRRSACLSLGENTQVPEIVGIDAFTSVPVAEESYGDIGGSEGIVSVQIERNPNRLGAEAWARSPRMGSPDGKSIQSTTLDGRAGVRVVEERLQMETTVVPVDDLMYMVKFTAPPGDPRTAAMRSIVASFAFVPTSTAPTPTSRPTRTAEAVADALAAGFAAKDAAGLANLMGDCMISGAEQGGFGSHSPERFVAILREQFAAGTTVAVRARPIESAPGFGAGPTLTIATTWADPGQAAARIDLIIGADGSFHFWRGMIKRLQAP